MRADAIFGPNGTEADLAPFRRPGIDLTRTTEVSMNTVADAALIFGGDGTIHRHLPSLHQTQIPVLVVPVGSGNDFANAMGWGTTGLALAAWQRFCTRGDNLRRIDLGLIAPLTPGTATARTYYCCVAGAGLDSDVNRRANQQPRWLRSRGGYIAALAPALAAFRPTRVKVSLRDAQINEDAMLVACANAPSYGGGMRIAPGADLADGKLDVCFVRRTGKLRLLRLFPKVFSGTHLGLPEVEYLQTDWLRIEGERPLDIYADGEYVCTTPAEVTVVPQALRVIAPSG